MGEHDTTELETAKAVSLPGLPEDWPDQATDRIVGLVDNIRGKTTGPAIKVGRMIVYGIVAAILGLVALVLLLVGTFRSLVVLTDVVFDSEEVWLAYLVFGGLLNLTGLLLWRKRPRGAAS